MGPSPEVPRLAAAVLGWLMPSADRAYALADLAEEFEERARTDGIGPARRWYWSQTLRSAGPAIGMRIRRVTGPRPDGEGRWRMGMHTMGADTRYALRTLAKAPVTVAVTVVSLGLGIGAVTTVFNVADGFLNPPAPGLTDPEGLVSIYTSEDDGEVYGSSSYPDFEQVRGVTALADAAASAIRLMSLEDGGGPEPILTEAVTGNFFDVTGIRPVLGRTFLPQEGTPDAGSAVAVLGHDLWTERFGADPNVVGRTLRVNGTSVTVVGVAPAGVVSRRVPVRPDLWVPLGSPQDRGGDLRDRRSREFVILGRYASGAALPELQAQLAVLEARLADEEPQAWTDDAGRPRAFAALPEQESRVNPSTRGVLGIVATFFFAATGLVLLIACANVTSLFLVRARSRSKEIAVRLALGAKRRQILRLLLTEGLILGSIAGAVGIGFAHVLTRAMAGFSPPVNVPIRLSFELSGRAYALAFFAAVTTGVVFSLIPALRMTRQDLAAGIKTSRLGTSKPGRRLGFGQALVSVQLAAALVLISGATLFVRSIQEASTLELGVVPAGVALFSRSVPDDVTGEGMQAFYQEMEDRLAQVPGARQAALARGVELTLLQAGAAVSIAGAGGLGPEQAVAGFRNSVTAGYFDALGVPLLRGRGIDAGDVAGANRVAVVNETLARTLWPGEDPLGRAFTLTARGPGPREDGGRAMTLEVVGLVRDGRYLDVDDPPTPYVWTSLYQDPSRTVAAVLKGASAEDMVQAIRTTVPPAPGEMPLLSPTTYESQLSFQFIHLRLAATVLGWGGGLGLFLALIGVYGVVAHTIAERTREIAVRRALGAEAPQVVRAMILRGLALAGIGVALGILVLLPAAHLIRGVLIGVSPVDPWALGSGALILVGTAAVASLVPAQRAARIDPMEALRQE